MFWSYAVTAWRSLRSHPGFAAINIINLSAGLSVALLLVLLIWTQTQIDGGHSDLQQVHRVTFSTPPSFHMQSDNAWATAPGPIADYLRESVPGMRAVAQIREVDETILIKGEPVRTRGFFADPSIFHILDGYSLDRSGAAQILSKPNTAVVTAETARRLFGDADPIGQTIMLGSGDAFTVSAILRSPTAPSHVQFEALFSMETLRVGSDNSLADWSTASLYSTYIRLLPGVNPDQVRQSMQEAAADAYGVAPDGPDTFQLQAVSDIPFSASLRNDPSGQRLPFQALYPLAILAAVVAFTAGFNYASLSVARSIRRSLEAGVRRALGAKRRQIIYQFVGEALLVSALAFVGAMILLLILIPAFSSLSVVQSLGITLSISSLLNPTVVGLCLATSLGVGLLSGLYPAWRLGRYNPSDVLSSRDGTRANGRETFKLPLQKSLTVVQFLFSTIFLVTGVVLYQQAMHMDRAEYGIDTESVLVLSLQDASYETVAQRLSSMPNVQSVSGASDLPGDLRRITRAVRIPGQDEVTSLQTFVVDPALLTDFGLQYYMGDEPNLDAFQGRQTLFLNEKATQVLGYDRPQTAIGEPLDIVSVGPRRVADIIENFRPDHIMRANQPAMLIAGPTSQYDHMLIKVRPEATSVVRAELADLWPDIDARNPLVLQSLDSIVRSRSAGIAEVAYVLSIAALIAIMISCLGLLGLTAYQVQMRTSEIAVRRAIGANVFDILLLLSKGFITLVALGVTIGLPIAWAFNQSWLENFPYRIDIGADTLIACSLCILLGALIAAGSQALPMIKRCPAAGLHDA